MVFYGTATQYRLYSAGECVVNVRVRACAEYSGVVPLCTLEQWMNSPPPIPLGACDEFDGVTPFYTPKQWAYYILPQTHRGQ